MLTEERHSKILNAVNANKSVKLGELCELLGTSESTVRRDLNALAQKGLLVKVHGGAISINDSFIFVEQDIEEKSKLFNEEKKAIARYAASLIDDGDFVFSSILVHRIPWTEELSGLWSIGSQSWT